MRIDEELVCRLEASAAQASFELAMAQRDFDPTGPCEVIKFGAGALISTGPGSYINRALGVTQPGISSEQFDEVEQFYSAKGMDPTIELSSWAPDATVSEFAVRGYQPLWFRAMYAVSLSAARPSVDDGVAVELSEVEDGIWPETIALAYGITDPAKRIPSDEMARAGRSVSSAMFYARIDGVIAGCASVQVVDDVAWLGPAVTVPELRRRGVHTALVAARFEVARELGCDLGAATAHPNGASARNMMRLGFEHTHTQVVMSLPAAVPG